MNRIKLELAASRRICTALTGISSTFSRKQLSFQQLFLLLYVVRCREHFSSILLLLENESYNSALALRRVLYDTFLRGMWISRCAKEDWIERQRQANFKLKFSKRWKLEKALNGPLNERALNKEKQFYDLGSGFIHSGLYETVMYPSRTHPKVAEHLSKTVHCALQNSTLRVLHIFLEYHLSLLKAIEDGREHGIDTPEAILAATKSIQNLCNQYCAEIREGKQADAQGEHDAGKREEPNMDNGIEADVATLEQCVESGSTGNLCEAAYRGINGWLKERQPSSNDALFKRAQAVAVKYAHSRSQ
jgi:hypothetical protein